MQKKVLQSKELLAILFMPILGAQRQPHVVNKIVPFAPQRALAKDQEDPHANQANQSFGRDHQTERWQVGIDNIRARVLAISRRKHAFEPRQNGLVVGLDVRHAINLGKVKDLQNRTLSVFFV